MCNIKWDKAENIKSAQKIFEREIIFRLGKSWEGRMFNRKSFMEEMVTNLITERKKGNQEAKMKRKYITGTSFVKL